MGLLDSITELLPDFITKDDYLLLCGKVGAGKTTVRKILFGENADTMEGSTSHYEDRKSVV